MPQPYIPGRTEGEQCSQSEGSWIDVSSFVVVAGISSGAPPLGDDLEGDDSILLKKHGYGYASVLLT